MPQLDPSVFPTQIFWLLVTFVPLYLILWRVVLPKVGAVLESRQRHIDADLGKAAKMKREADGVLADYEKALGAARAQASAAVRAASDEIAAASARRHAEFGTALEARTKAVESRIQAARDEALANLRSVAVEVAAAATAKLIGVRPPAEAVERAVARAVEEVG